MDEAYLDQVAPTRNPALVAALRRLGNPRRCGMPLLPRRLLCCLAFAACRPAAAAALLPPALLSVLRRY